jgi:hypothetical protein
MGRAAAPTVDLDDWGSFNSFASATGSVILDSFPWILMYAIIFYAARTIGPSVFQHCAQLEKQSERDYWAASVASCVNCFVLVPMAWKACEELGLLASNASFRITSSLSTMCCHAMFGYTFYDLLPLLYHRKEWSGVGMYMLHHICTLMSWGVAAHTGYAHAVVVPVLLLEITGPFTVSGPVPSSSLLSCLPRTS